MKYTLLLFIKRHAFYILAASLLITNTARADISDKIHFSGFARVVGGFLDTDQAEFADYSDKLDFSEQSLFAFQTDVELLDSLSISAQLLAHSSEERKSGVEWLYLTYRPSDNWAFKAGKLRTPFFRYSDVIDVGFAYPWISPPPQIYGGLLFSNYEGASASYYFNLDDLQFSAEGYYGVYSGSFDRNGEDTPLDINEIKGLIIQSNYNNFIVRASFVESSDFSADVPEFTQFSTLLNTLGFTENADSLSFDGKVTGYQVNMSYDTLDYFVAAEWSRLESDIFVVPNSDSFYITAGYNVDDFQFHLTYASSNDKSSTPVNSIPLGINPQFDQLSFVYDQITQNLPRYSLDSIILGARWDYKYNVAFKADVTFLQGEEGESSYFTNIQPGNFDRKATLYQVAIEWVF